MKALLLVFLLPACGYFDKSVEETDTETDKKQEIEALYADLLAEAEAVRDPETGWIVDDCDAMLWTGKYAASSGVSGVKIELAEMEPGRWQRRAVSPCWTEEKGDVGSKSTWSRDMALAGLFPWAYRTEQLEVLQRHEEYGRANRWKMGEPLADGRVVYTPSIIGILYQTIFTLGGSDNLNRKWPSVYADGLGDYQAHLQVMDIWIRGEIAGARGEGDAIPRKPVGDPELQLLDISEVMYERLREHSEREPQCWTYAAMQGTYGGMDRAVDLVLSGEFSCSYVRCGGEEGCVLAEKIWAVDLVNRRLVEKG